MKNLFSTAVIVFIFSLLSLMSFSKCTESNSGLSGNVDFYLLESFETLKTTAKIQNPVLKPEVFIKYVDLIYYDKDKYTFKLSDSAVSKLKATSYSTAGMGFAVVANGKIIYTGYFWPSFSSATCDWVVADPLILENNKLIIKLGYPSESFAPGIVDKRNDQVLLDIFDRDNKLK